MEWLNQQPPYSVIYVSFGSIIVLISKQLESIARALRNSEKHFLWVIKHRCGEEALPLPEGFVKIVKVKQ